MVGTLAEYQAQSVETLHPDWICYITDDVSGGISVYTKAQADSIFVAKGHEVIEFQAPTAGNNYTWYRKYADGWVEQGGVFTGLTNGSNSWLNKQVTLLITMADTNYAVLSSDCGIGSGSYIHGTKIDNRTTTSFYYGYYNGASDTTVSWQVSGMAA